MAWWTQTMDTTTRREVTQFVAAMSHRGEDHREDRCRTQLGRACPAYPDVPVIRLVLDNLHASW